VGYKGVIYAIKISVLREEWSLVYEVGILAVGEGGRFIFLKFIPDSGDGGDVLLGAG